MHRIGLGFVLLILVAQSHASSSIVGGWHFGDFEYPGARRYVLALFEDGVYYAVDNEFFNPARAPVMERGTYVYDQSQGTLFLTTSENHGRPWVISGRVLQATLAGDLLTISALGTTHTLRRVTDDNSAIVGSWYLGPDSTPRDNGVVISFLPVADPFPNFVSPPRGHYYMVESSNC